MKKERYHVNPTFGGIYWIEDWITPYRKSLFYVKDHDTAHSICKYMNQMNSKVEELYKIIMPIKAVCDKYNVPLEDLPAVFEEYIVRDNDGYGGYSMCEDCQNTCNEDIRDCENYKSNFKVK